MFYSKLIISVVLMANILYVYGYYAPDPVNCSIQRRCSDAEETVWATDDYQCYLFRNPCLFANDVCTRRSENKTDLKVVTKDECKKKCRDACTEELAPVCGQYNRDFETFSNRCEFYKASCQNDKSYIFTQTGPCPQN